MVHSNEALQEVSILHVISLIVQVFRLIEFDQESGFMFEDHSSHYIMID